MGIQVLLIAMKVTGHLSTYLGEFEVHTVFPGLWIGPIGYLETDC